MKHVIQSLTDIRLMILLEGMYHESIWAGYADLQEQILKQGDLTFEIANRGQRRELVAKYLNEELFRRWKMLIEQSTEYANQ